MSTISERKKDGKVISFKFLACLGRDADGKRICKGTTWRPPEGLSYTKARKLAEAEAYRWEQELRSKGATLPQGEYTTAISKTEEAAPVEEGIPEEETFRYFAEQVWLPLKVVAGGLRPSTIAMYGFMMRVSLPKLGDKRLKDITAVDIMRYLQYLRDEYRAPNGKKLCEKSIKHHYDILRIIFNYAERQEFIEKNPIKKVDAPRTVKRPVDALTQDQARIFFKALQDCKPEYRCMMLLMATTGIRRGEFDGWNTTNPGTSLTWWTAYNNIKHSRITNKADASQGNVLNALSALFLIEMRLLSKITTGTNEVDYPDEESSLFTLKEWNYRFVSGRHLSLHLDGTTAIIGG